jgi:hypothetical protein
MIVQENCNPFIYFTKLGELKAQKHVEYWLIKHWIAKSELTVIIAPPAAGKSLLALEMALSIATGVDWRGEKVKQKNKVFYVIGEGQKGFIDRVRAYEIENDICVDNCPFFLSNTSQPFNTAEGLTQVIKAIEQINEMPDVVFVDTLARSMHGDENSTENMGEFVKHCNYLSLYFNSAAIVVIHHTGKADPTRSRGSTALTGAADKIYLISVKDNLRTLSCIKAKNSAENDPKFFEIKSVGLGINDEDGDEINSAVLEEVSRPSTSTKSKKNDGSHLALECFKTAADEAGKVSDAAWRASFYERLKNDDTKTDNAIRMAYNRHKTYLLQNKIIYQENNYFYLTQ